MATSEPAWHPAAIADTEAARDWYAARSPLAARGFLLALDDAVHAVIAAPTRWPEQPDGCRHFVFPSNYPFTLVYHATPVLYVIAVAHHRRKPNFWVVR